MQSRQKAWHDRAMRSHQRDPICVGDWVYHYQGKIKPIGHKFVPKWKGYVWKTGKGVRLALDHEDTVAQVCTTSSQHQSGDTEYAIRGFNVEKKMLCFEARETPVTKAKIRKAFDIPQVGGEVDPTREIPTDTKWLEPYLRTKDLGSTTRLSYGKKALAPGFRRRIVTLAHALIMRMDYKELDWNVHHQRKCNQDDGNHKFFSPTTQGEEGKVRGEEHRQCLVQRPRTGRGTIWLYGKEILLNNKFFSKVFEFPNEVYEMEEPPSKIYNEYRPYLKEGTTWEEHLTRRAKTRGLQLSEFCAKVVAVLHPLSVIMGCRNNPKSVPINVLWVFIAADRNRFMNWAMIFWGLFFRVVETARKLMMKNNGGDTILYLLAHMSTFLDLRVGDYYKFRPYRMLTNVPDHQTTMAFFNRVETEEDGLFQLLKPGEPTDRVVTGIEEEETDAGEEDGPAAGSGWGGLYIDTSSKEGVQLYFDKTARTHPVPRPDTLHQLCVRFHVKSSRYYDTARTGKAPAEPRAKKAGGRGAGGSAAARLPATPRGAHIEVIPVHPTSANSPTPLRSSAPPFEIPVVRATEVTDMEQEHHQERQEEEVPADPWGGFAQEPELQPAQVLLHPTAPNAEEEMGRHQVLERVPPAPLPENGQQEAVPDDETCKRAHSPPHNGKGEHRKHRGDGREEPRQEARPSCHQQHKDTAQIFLTLAHEEEISQKLEGRLRTMEEKVSQFEGHLIGVQKFIEEHHKQLLTAITNLSERLPTTTDLPEDEQEELHQLRETNERYEQFFSNMPRPPVRTKGH
ncbi:hypothetical protein SELMODRAFT_407272 [Selaginella moellendorffii]|uniref:Uncharacterized protein n=1 Tax=Selaginella moellendorffii TaxID=88036 RepID=D8R4H4_SELML|nr:hypothetical protein SELMODRAFT_407272 [Selaginella moellendorffii]